MIANYDGRMHPDDDGKLNFVEFKEGSYHIYRNYYEFENPGDNLPSAEENFEELDVNKDKYPHTSMVLLFNCFTFHFLPSFSSPLLFFSPFLGPLFFQMLHMLLDEKCVGRFLAEEELRPILHHLYPGEMSYAKY